MMEKDSRNNTTSGRVMRKGEFLPAPSKKPSKKKKSNKKKKIIIVLVSILAVLAIIVAGVYAYLRSLLGNVSREEIVLEEIAVNEEVFDDKVINIALFGVDSRADVIAGRSDSIIILTIDQKHDKIKMSSIARDTYVAMDGHGNDKLTHAYVYGGATLAIKTLNQNFNMDIQDYATVNFYGLVDIIDEIGGVMLDVDAGEMSVMNGYVKELKELGVACDYVTTTGEQRLSGGQALAYARNRYSGGNDVERGNRQKEVLTALYDEVKNVSVTKYPSLINMVLKNCETSLSDGEITDLALWAARKSPSIENLSLPDAECNPRSGDAAMINGVWYYIYDLDIATQKLHDFINEDSNTNTEDTADQTTEE